MSADNLPLSLQVLQRSSSQLSEHTQFVNDTLRAVELALIEDCQPGIEQWVGGSDFGADSKFSIGLVKQQKGWRLCIAYPDDSQEDGVAVRPWENCPRDVKFVAAKGLPALVSAIQQEVDTELRAAEEARAALVSLHPRDEAE